MACFINPASKLSVSMESLGPPFRRLESKVAAHRRWFTSWPPFVANTQNLERDPKA
jgi:hypothetical protein